MEWGNVWFFQFFLCQTNGTSNGLLPMLRVYNATARYVDQGGNKVRGDIHSDQIWIFWTRFFCEMADCLMGYLLDFLIGRLIDCFLIDWLIGASVMYCYAYWLIDWLVDCVLWRDPAHSLFTWSPGMRMSSSFWIYARTLAPRRFARVICFTRCGFPTSSCAGWSRRVNGAWCVRMRVPAWLTCGARSLTRSTWSKGFLFCPRVFQSYFERSSLFCVLQIWAGRTIQATNPGSAVVACHRHCPDGDRESLHGV